LTHGAKTDATSWSLGVGIVAVLGHLWSPRRAIRHFRSFATRVTSPLRRSKLPAWWRARQEEEDAMVPRRLSAAIVVMTLLSVSCGGTASPTPVPPTAPAPSTTAAPSTAVPPSAEPSAAVKPGGTLVVAIPGDIKRTDPAFMDEPNSIYVVDNVIEGLVWLPPGSTSGPVIPALAESWTVSPDGTVYTFKIRTGVKFHDGTDLNAEAVKFNWDRWIGMPPELQGYSAPIGQVLGGYGGDSNVAKTEVLDPTTFVVTVKQPNSSFLIQMTLPQFGISSPTALVAGKADNTELDITKIPYAQGGPPAMVGTGAFKFDKWIKGQEIDLVKNADYWDRTNVALVDNVVFKPIADETATLNGLLSGDIDVAQKVSPTDIANIKANPQLQVIDRGSSCDIGMITLNQNYSGHVPGPANAKEILTNLKIRQAIMYAIDRQALVDTFLAGYGVPADNWMPLDTAFAIPLDLPTYDPAMAQQLISESGVAPGDLVVDFYYPSDITLSYQPDSKGEFQAIQSNLEAVGFTVQPHTTTWSPTFLEEEYGGKYEMSLVGWNCAWAGPDDYLKRGMFGYINGQPSAEFGYTNDALDKAMTDAVRAPDEATARSNWESAQKMIAADLPTIPLVNSQAPAIAQAYVKGFVGAGNYYERFNTVWLDK
jgi:peptide/nickel transport system substrate-binding protein